MKPFPDHNRTHEPGTTFSKPSWLLMIEINGTIECYTDGSKTLDLECAEWDHDVAAKPFLESANAPREEIELGPEPAFKNGASANWSLRFPTSIFTPELITEGLLVELSIIGDGIDLAERVVVAAGRTQNTQWGDEVS